MVSAAEVLQYLKGIDFPVGKDGLVKKARDNHAPVEVINLLNKLPDQKFRSAVDINIAIGDIE